MGEIYSRSNSLVQQTPGTPQRTQRSGATTKNLTADDTDETDSRRSISLKEVPHKGWGRTKNAHRQPIHNLLKRLRIEEKEKNHRKNKRMNADRLIQCYETIKERMKTYGLEGEPKNQKLRAKS
jgi:hypothetical protein